MARKLISSLYPKIPRQQPKKVTQIYDCYLILDFEATCQKGTLITNQEIIEFPVLKVNGRDFSVTNKFHEYIKPVYNPILTDFCTKLTGITQEMVDTGKTFPEVLNEFDVWMKEIVKEDSFLFVTCGNWDLKVMLPSHCLLEKLPVPSYFNSWMDIKKIFRFSMGEFPKGMAPMLPPLGLTPYGRPHSGIDDCHNIANILKALGRKGNVQFKPTSKI